ncbi:MAG TPA: lasso peptide biosynthesis B2 protein [Candidatus Binataceae bacterium]
MSRIAKFLALSGGDRALLLEASVALVAMRAGVLAFSYPRVRKMVARASAPRAREPEQARPGPDKIAWAVAAASSAIPGGGNCLVRALATEVMLGRAGYPCQLRIGVAKPNADGFKAHAWLESGGKIVIGRFELGEYVALDRRPEAGN